MLTDSWDQGLEEKKHDCWFQDGCLPYLNKTLLPEILEILACSLHQICLKNPLNCHNIDSDGRYSLEIKFKTY